MRKEWVPSGMTAKLSGGSKRAAKQHYAWGEFLLGTLYKTGRGVEANLAEAAKWYRKAAEQGLSLAQNNLGAAYANGEGVERNFSEAVKWLRLAADQGVEDARFNLAINYSGAQHDPPNYGEAYFWALVAEHNVDPSVPRVSQELLKELREHVAPEEAERAEKRAQDWIEKQHIAADVNPWKWKGD